MIHTATLRWQIFTRDGELIAATRFAIDAARVAISNGHGATVKHDGERVVLTVTDDSIAEGALPLADQMIAIAYGRHAA